MRINNNCLGSYHASQRPTDQKRYLLTETVLIPFQNSKIDEWGTNPSFPINHLDANSFNITLYEMSHGSLNYKSDRIESLLSV